MGMRTQAFLWKEGEGEACTFLPDEGEFGRKVITLSCVRSRLPWEGSGGLV